MINWILIIGFGLILFFLAIAVLQLAGIRRGLDTLSQVVAIGIQRAGLVRTPEEAEEDARQAHEEEEETEGDVF